MNDGSMYIVTRVILPPGGLCTGGFGGMEYQGIRSETTGHHHGIIGLMVNISAVQWNVIDADV